MAQLTDTKAAADYVGLTGSTLEKQRCFGGGPRYLKLGRVVRYRISDLDDWLEERTIASTSEQSRIVRQSKGQSNAL
jgi:predicted DNA-binding transcriptional regulator AlpA